MDEEGKIPDPVEEGVKEAEVEQKQEKDITAEEKLEQLNAERKSLREQISSEKEIRLAEAAKMRIFRDEKIEKIQVKLKNISEAIYAYNKLGKVAKNDYDILQKITEEINCPDEDVVADSEE